MMPLIIHMLLTGAGGVVVLFLAMWIVHLILNNATVVDIGWGLGFILLSLIYILEGQGFNIRNTICFAMIFCWGMRIVLYLFKRISLENTEDKRYKKIRQGFGRMAWLNTQLKIRVLKELLNNLNSCNTPLI